MKTTYNYDHYFDQEEREKIIAELLTKYPDLLKEEVLLKTKENRQMLALTISNFNNGSADEKCAFYIDGNTHAGEVTGMMACMYSIDALLSNYGLDEKVTFLLDNYTFYIIPCVSPDGSDTYLHSPYTLRSVNRAYDETKKQEGLIREDLDHDGVIRMMRVKNPSGKFKKDPENEEFMIPRDLDDINGDFYDVYSEGLIKDYDGVNIKVADEQWALDFNRNYPFGWLADYRQDGAGPYPLSNPETKAVVDFVIKHKNIACVLTHHTSGGILLTPPGTYSPLKAAEYDMDVYKQLGKICKETMGYEDHNIFDSFLSDKQNYDSGAFDDYCYENKGIFACTMELWNIEERAGQANVWGQKESLEEQCTKLKKCYKWVIDNVPEAYKSWQSFNHPQLGEVEIGGFEPKFTFQNPPKKFLAQELEKTFNFTMSYASMMPRIIVKSINKEKLAEGLYKVNLIISNTAYLPTYISEKAKKIGVNKGIKITIDGEVVQGKNEINIGELSGYSKTLSSAMYMGNIVTFDSENTSAKISFIVKGEKFVVTISGDKINNITLQV